ncbi:glycosyltransferase family 2 protein [Bacillus sp. ISL-18]|uniref:glycosyltransferase family 2 protein n=1 Tax=Bacillus sp. ISL-18 TaxID=2819118 RepID=UPI001BE54951|nr:glycosyltransferase family 2 protein [Bacillus sp. ISL-18]MBT2657261.1 glycosyltransferase family 2 protein [Bacillus sp. ISL-18]
MNRKFKVCAVMVCFYPDIEELSSNINAIVGQVEKLIIVDNSEKPVNHNFLNENDQVSKIEWVSLKENLGIGAAHNVGIKMALEQNFDGILLLDQDSNPPKNLVKELASGMEFLNDQGIKVACLGPDIFNKNTNETYKPLVNKGVELSEDFVEKDVLISSGKLISAEAVKQIGMMDEALFIDLVDFEWCWRARKDGFRVFSSKRVRMGHMVGQKNVKILNVYNLLIPSPLRHYYQFRNTIFLLKRGYVPRYWKIKALIERCIELFLYSLLISPRLIRSRYIFKGIKDGLFNRKGKLING